MQQQQKKTEFGWEEEKKKKMMTRQRKEVINTAKLFKYLLIGLIVFLVLVCLYNGTSFAPRLPRADDAAEDGADPVTGRVLSKRFYLDELPEDQERNPEVPRSIPVCLQLTICALFFFW